MADATRFLGADKSEYHGMRRSEMAKAQCMREGFECHSLYGDRGLWLEGCAECL
ncbi:MAG: hypothetical protein M2R45_02000 [Verrucomicrobia subdivision 3 bacterium]|nr:hypothetical protein [Limisphaerales bacterium]MCS1414818.1 hypothetical protein [Limisphaerales bacterium]